MKRDIKRKVFNEKHREQLGLSTEEKEKRKGCISIWDFLIATCNAKERTEGKEGEVYGILGGGIGADKPVRPGTREVNGRSVFGLCAVPVGFLEILENCIHLSCFFQKWP